MTSRRAAALAGTCALAAAACGQGVHDLTVASDPLIVLHGHVDVPSLDRKHPDAALLGALIWAEVPGVNPVCVEFAADDRIKSACPDPAGVFTGEIEVSVPVGADGNFDLPLFHLPMVSVSVGDAATRIAYGSLVVIEDANGDGQPSLVPPPGGDEFDAPSSEPTDPDRIVAATFYSLDADQQRVVFREGAFVPGSYFYPGVPPGCEPPSGFSIMTAPPQADPPTCNFDQMNPRLELTPLTQAEGLAFMCRAVQKDSTVRQPDRAPRGSPDNACLGPNVIAAVYPGICPWLRSYALAGCQQDPMCISPEWDFRASVPDWWSRTCP
jgi:hypothetical protein